MDCPANSTSTCDRITVYATGLRRGQEGDQMGDFDGVDEPTHRIPRHEFGLYGIARDATLHSQGFDYSRCRLGAGKTWMNDGYVHPFGPEFIGEVLGHGSHGDVAHTTDR